MLQKPFNFSEKLAKKEKIALNELTNNKDIVINLQMKKV